GPDEDRQRARGHPQREHAALHRAPRSLLHAGRAPDLGKDRRGALRSRRRGGDNRTGGPGRRPRSPPRAARHAGRRDLLRGRAGIFGRRFAGTPPLATATGQGTASSLTLLPLALLVDRPWLFPLPGARTWGAVVGLAVLCTALAYVIYFRVLASAGRATF